MASRVKPVTRLGATEKLKKKQKNKKGRKNIKSICIHQK